MGAYFTGVLQRVHNVQELACFVAWRFWAEPEAAHTRKNRDRVWAFCGFRRRAGAPQKLPGTVEAKKVEES